MLANALGALMTQKTGNHLVGMDLEAAEKFVADKKITHDGVAVTSLRVVVENGEPQMCTKDYRTDRGNVETEGGKVTKFVGCN